MLFIKLLLLSLIKLSTVLGVKALFQLRISTDDQRLKRKEIRNPDRTREIKLVLCSPSIGIIPPIVEIIEGYECSDRDIYESYNKIMDSFKVPEKERKDLDLYSKSFMSWLLERVKESGGRFLLGYRFLERFMFTWILAMRKLFANDDASFEAEVADAKPIIVMLLDGYYPQSYTAKLQSTGPFDFSVFDTLMKYESLDNSHILEYFINHVIQDLHLGTDGKLKITCEDLRNKHFGSSFNNNPLLKLMLIAFTLPEVSNQIKKKCFPREILNFHDHSDFAAAISELFSGNREHQEIGSLIEYLDEDYISLATVMFLLDNKLGFRVHTSSALIYLLRRLDKLGLLFQPDIPTEKIIKFKFEAESVWKWDADRFKRYLNERKYDTSKLIYAPIIQRDEYDRYASLS
jgi:hypothetical protein